MVSPVRCDAHDTIANGQYGAVWSMGHTQQVCVRIVILPLKRLATVFREICFPEAAKTDLPPAELWCACSFFLLIGRYICLLQASYKHDLPVPSTTHSSSFKFRSRETTLIMFDPSSFANPTPLAHADTSRDVLPRGEWCRAPGNWTAAEWNQVVFTDESRFNLSNDNRVRVWRPRIERLYPVFALQRHTTPTTGVMIWAAIAYNTRSPLVLIRGTMTAQQYVHDILQPHVLPFGQRLPGAIFQQDNALPHTARVS
ncbi:transposable element Tcb2 transposase [Trichonephila clavipes]|nr:transposable element Tcb2 transposase [Trichonephila clavipes]